MSFKTIPIDGVDYTFMLTFQDHVIARPSESAVSCVDVLSLLLILQDLAPGQGSQGWWLAMLMC